MYWCAVHLQPQHERYALHCLGVNGYEVYYPRLRQCRVSHGRKIETRPPLFPGYCFILIELQWHAARWAPGVISLIMDGVHPARVPDAVIAEIRSRERGGLVELPKPPGFRKGERVKIIAGPFSGRLALYSGMAPRERVLVLLSVLGGEQRVTLPAAAIEAVAPPH